MSTKEKLDSMVPAQNADTQPAFMSLQPVAGDGPTLTPAVKKGSGKCASYSIDDGSGSATTFPANAQRLKPLPPGISSRNSSVSVIAAAVTPSMIDDPKKYPLAPFNLAKDDMEHVGLNSGNLSLTVTDFTLPGKNGFDLAVNRIYNSSMSNELELTPLVEKVTFYTWYIYHEIYVKDETLSGTGNITLNWEHWSNVAYQTRNAAKEAAEDYWAEHRNEYQQGEWVEYFNYDLDDYSWAEIRYDVEDDDIVIETDDLEREDSTFFAYIYFST